jgi:hypothetical protein
VVTDCGAVTDSLPAAIACRRGALGLSVTLVAGPQAAGR